MNKKAKLYGTLALCFAAPMFWCFFLSGWAFQQRHWSLSGFTISWMLFFVAAIWSSMNFFGEIQK